MNYVCSNIAPYLVNSISRVYFTGSLRRVHQALWISLFIKAPVFRMPLIHYLIQVPTYPRHRAPQNVIINIPRACSRNQQLYGLLMEPGYPWIVTKLSDVCPYTLPLSPTFNQHILTLYSDPSDQPLPQEPPRVWVDITVSMPSLA